MKFIKSLAVAAIAALALLGVTACQDDATVATKNVIRAADNFEVNRRIVFYNGITDTYALTIEGLCSVELGASNKAFNVICKTGPRHYKRHNLILSDNVTAFTEQLESVKASAYHYRVTFKPSVIIPDINIRTPGNRDNRPIGNQ